LEQQLAADLKMIYVMGKRGRAVPVLIPQDCQEPLKTLSSLQLRTEAGISPDNIYLFANTGFYFLFICYFIKSM